MRAYADRPVAKPLDPAVADVRTPRAILPAVGALHRLDRISLESRASNTATGVLQRLRYEKGSAEEVKFVTERPKVTGIRKVPTEEVHNNVKTAGHQFQFTVSLFNPDPLPGGFRWLERTNKPYDAAMAPNEWTDMRAAHPNNADMFGPYEAQTETYTEMMFVDAPATSFYLEDAEPGPDGAAAEERRHNREQGRSRSRTLAFSIQFTGGDEDHGRQAVDLRAEQVIVFNERGDAVQNGLSFTPIRTIDGLVD